MSARDFRDGLQFALYTAVFSAAVALLHGMWWQ